MAVDASNILSSASARIKRTEAYAEKVRKMFAQTVNEILALNKTMPKLDEGAMFSFDGESKKKQQEVERLLRQLHSATTAAIKQGITLEWDKANEECDKLVSSAFGKAFLSSSMFSAWTQRNESAMQAFINRSEKGLNLSDRVWQSVRQLRDEMEVAITVGIGEGQSAASMSRKVRQYLNDPDLMFRRFRYKDESGEWRLKWKKRIKDEKTGKYKWIDYDKGSYQDDWTGKGYYKSAAQNAMRVTRTETNIAYRRADNERWAQMDFVLGQRVQLSRSHPRKDICDKLQGDYPKEFVFDGWHPQCFCFVTPILVDEEEMVKCNEAFLKGEKYTPQGKQVTEYPEAFKSWVKDHAEDIAKARQKGTEPYFIRNNKDIIDNILNPKPKELTTLEKAEIRHNSRTPEQIADIKARAAERQKKHALIKKTADNVLKVAKGYGEVDYAKLEQYISEGNLTAMRTEAKAVAHSVSAMKKQEAALSSLIPDAHSWHQQFTMAELQDVYAAVEKKMQTISALSSLEAQAKALSKEINYVADPTYLKPHKQYSTWKVSQDAYLKQLASVNNKIALQEIQKELAAVSAWSKQHTQSKKVAALLADAESAIANGEDLAAIKNKAALATAEYQKRLAEQARRDAKKATAGTSFGADAYTKSRKNKAKYFKKAKDANDYFYDSATEYYKTATDAEKEAFAGYTAGSAYITEPLRAINGHYYYDWRGTKGTIIKKHIDEMTKALSRCTFKDDIWIKRDDASWQVEYAFGIKDLSAFKGNPNALVGKIGTDNSFWSCGDCRETRFTATGRKDVIYNIYCPKGTQGVYAHPFSSCGAYGKNWDGVQKCSVSAFDENEIILQRGIKYRITKAEYDANKDQWYLDIEILSQKPLDYDLENSGGWYCKFK